MYAALRHPGLRVVAFEPEYSNLHLLKENLVENGLKERVEIYAVALGKDRGLSHLHLQDLTPGAALNSESRSPLAMTRSHLPVVWREGIYVMTLDGFCEETGLMPSTIKLDVDGNEGEILEGGARVLRSRELKSILVESEDPAGRERSSRFLSEAGFRLRWRDPSSRSSNQIWVRS
ncbi:MAG: FkbM family methyltransferase [Candidatus Omnitrophica bacterium]|nr:FkbM family methyltransferase [Candidatus Omnitrophota bacterium]